MDWIVITGRHFSTYRNCDVQKQQQQTFAQGHDAATIGFSKNPRSLHLNPSRTDRSLPTISDGRAQLGNSRNPIRIRVGVTLAATTVSANWGSQNRSVERKRWRIADQTARRREARNRRDEGGDRSEGTGTKKSGLLPSEHVALKSRGRVIWRSYFSFGRA